MQASNCTPSSDAKEPIGESVLQRYMLRASYILSVDLILHRNCGLFWKTPEVDNQLFSLEQLYVSWSCAYMAVKSLFAHP